MIVAVMGGGQLGRMLGLAGIPMGMRFRFLEPAADCPAAAVGEVVVGAYDDRKALKALVRGADVVTYEFENVPVAAARWIESLAVESGPSADPFHVDLCPGSRSLLVAQDRVEEKAFFERCGLPVQSYAAVEDEQSLARAIEVVGVPSVIKTRRLGYDGKGQCVVRDADQLLPAWTKLGRGPCILESFVPFAREVSMVAVRARDGDMRWWPLVENEHVGGILAVSRVPATDAAALERSAQRHVQSVADALEHVGVLAIEFFVVEEAGSVRLIANEMAPRVHNSGHWTIEGAVTSQFANHLRAVAGLPLGSTALRGAAAMVNLVGDVPDLADLLRHDGVTVHLYGKERRAGRKLGHVTVVGADRVVVARTTASVRELAWGAAAV
ncbi:MAG: 5-(carboxyamino)imidazole ribonucleotide synthase [Phycisphaerales bacterium]|nr:5-(carboxyamino)imidazole ribonucleotide synthase [Phycisphaerales bacterium]